MKRYFQIIHFVPNPVSGARVPMGAIVVEGPTRRVAIAKHLPGAECLGSRESARLLNFLIDDLKNFGDARDFHHRMGPEIAVDEARPIPSEVRDAVTWLEKFVLPRQLAADEKGTRPRRPSRYMEGKSFLNKHEVGQYVRRSFQPQKVFPEVDDGLRHLGKVSQYVLGDGKVLLMEPLVPRRPDWEDDLTAINTTFSAYRFHVDNGLNGHSGELIAYILPGGDEKRRAQIRRTLESATSVVDTARPHQLNRFVKQLRDVGENQSELRM